MCSTSQPLALPHRGHPAASALPAPCILHPVFDVSELTRTESETAGVGVKAEECFIELFDE